MKVIIIYHDEDIDGRMSGLLLAKAYDDHVVTLLGKTNANKKIPNLDEYNTVIVTDYSLLPQDMLKLRREDRLVWFDHHAHNIEVAKQYGYDKVPGLRDTSMSATALVYMKMTDLPQELKPLVNYVDEYDMWRKSDNWQTAVNINAYLMTMTKNFMDSWLHEVYLLEPWQALEFASDVGSYIRKSRTRYTQEIAVPHGGSIDGVPVVAYNYINSELGDGVPEGSICLMYVIKDKNTVKVSLRSKDMDCNAIAQGYGGGGHVAAAGFTCDLNTLQTFL